MRRVVRFLDSGMSLTGTFRAALVPFPTSFAIAENYVKVPSAQRFCIRRVK